MIYRWFFAVLTVLAAISASPSAAQNVEMEGSLDLMLRAVEGGDNAKFQEYRDMSPGLLGGFGLSYDRARSYFRANGMNIGLDDQRLDLVGGNYGRYKVSFLYDQTPHRFAFDTPSIWSGFGSGRLTLPASIRADAQAVSGAAVIPILQQYFDNADLRDWELQRKQMRTVIEIPDHNDLSFRLEMGRENRDGTRPFFGAFGSGGAVAAYELPEPINYTTDSARVSAEYATSRHYLQLGYDYQSFKNETGSLIFDNPLIAVTAPGGVSSTGQLDLAPSNSFHTFTLTGGLWQLPMRGRLTATVSSGKMKQNDLLLPPTTNPDTPVSPLPASTAEARVDTTMYRIAFTADPAEKLDFRASHYYYDYDNRTPVRAWPHVVGDAAGSEDSLNVPTSFTNKRTKFDLGYELAPRLNVGAGYESRSVNRTNREVSDQDEDVWFLEFDSRTSNWLTLRASYEHSNRSGSYDFSVPFVEAGIDPDNLAALRKFDEANRERDFFQFLATANPTEALTLTGSVGYSRNKYDDSEAGLLRDKSWLVSLDGDYAFPRGGSVYAYLIQEKFSDRQLGWQWQPPETPESVNEYSQWTADSSDRVTTLGLGFELPLRPNKLDLRMNLSHSKSNGAISFDSPLGPGDRNPWVPLPFNSVEDTTLQALDTHLRYVVDERVTASIGWRYERFRYSDFQADGFQNIPVAGGNWRSMLFMDTLWKPYSANVFYGTVNLKF